MRAGVSLVSLQLMQELMALQRKEHLSAIIQPKCAIVLQKSSPILFVLLDSAKPLLTQTLAARERERERTQQRMIQNLAR